MESSEILYPPLAVVKPDDRRGVLWTVGVICLAFIHFTFALRVFVRWRRFQPDDYAIFAACILVVCQAAVTFGAVGLGLGSASLTRDNGSDRGAAWRLFAASEAFFVAATFTAKSAVLLTIEKLLGRHMKEWRAVFQYTIGVVAFAGLACILAVTVDCSESSCNYRPRWIAVTVIDSVTEIWGFSLFCWIIASLQMKLAFKLTAIGILSLRLFCIAFAGVHAYYVSTFRQGLDDSVGAINPLAWQQIALTWSLLSAMAVALRPFLRELHMGFGMDVGHVAGSQYGKKGSYQTKNWYKLKDLSKEERITNPAAFVARGESGSRDNGYRSDDIEYSAKIYREDRTASVGAVQPVIRREVEYTVTYENSR